MIQCRIRHLFRRCQQRGYTFDEVRECIVSHDGCYIIVDVDHPSYPRKTKPGFKPSATSKPCNDDGGLSVEEARRRLRGLGDITADSLASVGITKERVTYWLGRDCGCDARQEWLNKVGLVFGVGRPPISADKSYPLSGG